MATEPVVKHVVLDSGAFLRNAPIQNIGEKVYTIPEVVEEIKDKATKQRLQVLPYELIYREPPSEAVKTVTDFAKKTGDYGSLSAVDIRVMALTLQLEKENVGIEHIKTVPEKKVEWNCTTRNLEKPTDIAGFYVKSKKSTSRTTSECSSRSDESKIDRQTDESSDIVVERLGSVNEEQVLGANRSENDIGDNNSENCSLPKQECIHTDRLVAKISHSDNVIPVEENKQNDNISELEKANSKTDNKTELKELDNEKTVNANDQNKLTPNSEEPLEGEIIPADCLEEGFDDSSENESDDNDDDDDEGWITPSNIKNVKEHMGMMDSEKANVLVGCLTTDFAMQNVLIQMGLNVISVDGMLIKRARSYILRCFACMKITTNVQKVFCPHCGNRTLTKVSMTVNEDGSIRYFLSKRPISKRGTKFSLPAPKGGKHANNPHLVEDQPHPHQRTARKAQNKLDVFSPDYFANQSPFAVNDVTSRAAQLGIKTGHASKWDRRNPNAGRKNHGRRK